MFYFSNNLKESHTDTCISERIKVSIVKRKKLQVTYLMISSAKLDWKIVPVYLLNRIILLEKNLRNETSF